MAIVMAIARKRDGNRDALRTRLRYLSCFGKVGENAGKFHTFCEEEIAEILPQK